MEQPSGSALIVENRLKMAKKTIRFREYLNQENQPAIKWPIRRNKSVPSFKKSAIKAIAEIATEVNTKTENIGARRLHTVMTTLLDEYMYEKVKGKSPNGTIEITPKIVKEKLSNIAKDQDLSRYIL